MLFKENQLFFYLPKEKWNKTLGMYLQVPRQKFHHISQIKFVL